MPRRHGDSQWVGLMADAERAVETAEIVSVMDDDNDDDTACNMTLLIPQHNYSIYFK